MLRMGEEERPNITPRRMGGPSDYHWAMGTQPEMEVPMAMIVVYIEEGREKEMETPQ